MSNWYNSHMNAIAGVRQAHYGKTEHAPFHINDPVQLTSKVVTETATLPPYIVGRVSAIDERGLTVDFDGYGKQRLGENIARDYLVPARQHTMSDIMHASMSKAPGKLHEFKIGDRVTDRTGAAMVIERIDPISQTAMLTDGTRLYPRPLRELKVSAGAPGTAVVTEQPRRKPATIAEEGERQTIGSDGLAPGNRVRVTAIDPNLNQWRRYAVQQGEAGGIVGQEGTVIAAYYPTGIGAGGESQGETMYRVQFPFGGTKDFSGKELAVSGMGGDGLVREAVDRRVLHRPGQRRVDESVLEEGLTFSRRHYERIADLVRHAQLPDNDRHEVLEAFGRTFRSDNPHYDHNRFLARARGDFGEAGRASREGVTAMPTQRHFVEVARTLREAHINPDSRNKLIAHFGRQFGGLNERYKHHLFHRAAGGVGQPMVAEDLGGVTSGAVVHQPKVVSDKSSIKPKKQPTKLGASVKTGLGTSGVVVGEEKGLLTILTDDGRTLRLSESALMPAVGGAPKWLPPQTDYKAAAIKLGDLVSFQGIGGVVAESDGKLARVLMDNGEDLRVPLTSLTLEADDDDDKDDKKKPAFLKDKDDDSGSKKKEKSGSKKNDDDDDDDDEDDDDRKDESILAGMAPPASMGITAPSMARVAGPNQVLEGQPIEVTGHGTGTIMGFTKLARNGQPTEARVSLPGGHEILVTLSERRVNEGVERAKGVSKRLMRADTQARLTTQAGALTTNIDKVAQRLGEEAPKAQAVGLDAARAMSQSTIGPNGEVISNALASELARTQLGGSRAVKTGEPPQVAAPLTTEEHQVLRKATRLMVKNIREGKVGSGAAGPTGVGMTTSTGHEITADMLSSAAVVES